jgi:anti-sigma-K factor RskA
MNLSGLHRKLIAAARAHPPGDQVPYAFEQRILAQLAARPRPDPVALWARALWRSAGISLAFVLLFGALSFLLPAKNTANDLSQEFEKTMLSAVNQDSDAVW